jgi:hypothetical protein
VAVRSKAWTVFARSNTGIVGSNPAQGMDVCLRLFCVCVGSGLATCWSPVQGALPTVYSLRNWRETKRFTDAPCSKLGAAGKRENCRNGAMTFRQRTAYKSAGNPFQVTRYNVCKMFSARVCRIFHYETPCRVNAKAAFACEYGFVTSRCEPDATFVIASCKLVTRN